MITACKMKKNDTETTRQMSCVFHTITHVHSNKQTDISYKISSFFILENENNKILQIFFVSWAPDDHGLQDEKEWHWNNETDVMCFPHDNHLFGHFPLLLLLLLLYLFTAMAAHCTVYNFTKFHFSEIKYTLRASLSCDNSPCDLRLANPSDQFWIQLLLVLSLQALQI